MAAAERQAVVAELAELFREQGFEGTSLSAITARTGLGKGSLYNLFPGGKEEMGEAVLAAIEAWFAEKIFTPLDGAEDARAGLLAMLAEVESYFRGGGRICLVGAFALDATRDRFSGRIDSYFEAWTAAIAGALERLGRRPPAAQREAETMLAALQGGLVLARARNDRAVFRRIVAGLAASVTG